VDNDQTKAQRGRLRELAGRAYERELSDQLAKVEQEFGRWHAGELDAFDLADLIHRFHQGPARALYSKYDQANLEFAVAEAIHRGILSTDEVGADLVEHVARHLVFLRRDDSSRSP
jgi:hypothetical protein